MKNSSNRRIIIWNIVGFLVIGILFFCVTYFSNTVLSAYDVTGIRLSATFNPVFGIAFGWSAVIACAVANFVSDLASGWGISVAFLGFIPQIIYGIFPYYVWKHYNHSLSKRTRLDNPRKTIMFAVLMFIDSIFIGLSVGGIQKFVSNDNFWETARFSALNDFDMCLVFGLPLMAVIDYIYSKILHGGKRKLSANEIILLITSVADIAVFGGIISVFYLSHPEMQREILWKMIFEISLAVFNVLLILSIVVMYFYHSYKIKHAGLRIFEMKNGTIFVDEKKCLEFVSFPGRAVGDRIKFSSSDNIFSRRRNMPSYEDSWCTMLSNQKGCPMKCKFCDVPDYGYHGNVSREEMNYQIQTILNTSQSTHTKMFEVNFMRMGEPTFNNAILEFIEFDLQNEIRKKVNADVIFPALSTMLPKGGKNTLNYLKEYCRIKNEVYDGQAALQFSINTTDDEYRDNIFRGRSLRLSEIAEIGNNLPYPKGLKYELNFAVPENAVIDPKIIDSLFDKEKFCIKMTPLHDTFNAKDSGFKVADVYEKQELFCRIEAEFRSLGWDVLIHMDRKEDDDDLLTCGNLLLSNIGNKNAKSS